MHTRSSSNAGFSLLEALVAALLLSFVGIVASQTLLNAEKGVVAARRGRNAASLANMILEQYNAYAIMNFYALNTYRKTNVTATDFFGSQTNDSAVNSAAYKNILITTLATYDTNRTSCVVAVILTWAEGGRSRTATFSKTYAASPPPLGGGTVEVWIRPCPTCPGFGGITVSAPSASSTLDIRAVTDSTGHAFLKNVRLNSVVVTAKGSGSRWDDPAAVPGYYVDGAGGLTDTLTAQIAVTEAGPNTVEFNQFLPLGQVSGVVKKSGTALQAIRISLVGSADDGAGNFQACNQDCSVLSDVSGRYVLNNVAPGNLEIHVEGNDDSSDPTVPALLPGGTANPDFKPAYVGSPPMFSDAMTPASIQNPARPQITQDITMVQKGWLTLHAIDAVTGLPMAGALIGVNSPYLSYTLNTDANGMAQLYNLFDVNPDAVVVSGYQAAIGPQIATYFPNTSWTCQDCLNHENLPPPLAFGPTQTLDGRLIDSNNQAKDILVDLPQPLGGSLTDITNGSGKYHLTGFAPGLFDSDASNNPITYLDFSKVLPAPGIDATVQGTIVEQQTNLKALWVPFILSDGESRLVSSVSKGPSGDPSSGADGTFSIHVHFDNWHGEVWDPTIQCVVNNGCQVDDQPINTLEATLDLADTGSDYFNPWNFWGLGPITVTNNQTVSNLEGHSQLCYYATTGQVSDEQGHPLAGVTVTSDRYQTTTASDGTYGINAWIVDIGGRSASSPGSLYIDIPEQTVGGVTFNGQHLESGMPSSVIAPDLGPNPQPPGDPPVMINAVLTRKIIGSTADGI